MKVGILTFCHGYNYGAVLQCYALQKYLRLNNIDAEVINFSKKKQYNKSGLNLLSPAYTFRKAYAFLYRRSIKLKRKKFDSFINENINFYPNNNIEEKDIINYIERYELLIFGSDQIWNMSDKIYDKSNIYFGDFDFSGGKLAYAASFGDSTELAENNIDYIKKMLNSFSAISVREKSGNDFLIQNGINSVLTVDPTLLLSRNSWLNLCRESEFKRLPSKYILYYSVNCRKYSWEVAKKLSKITGLKVVNLEEHPKIVGANFINDYAEGPNEFLSLIKNAEYIVTNSFHGTVFSIMFEKRFIPVFEMIDGDILKEERKYSLLQIAGLTDLITTINTPIVLTKYDNINYKSVHEKIDLNVNFSRDFIRNNVRYEK